MVYVLAVIGIVYALAVLGALQQLVTALRRLAELMASDSDKSNTVTQAQVRMVEAQEVLMRQQTAALADQAAYRDEQRQHMATCAKRYEAMLVDMAAPGDVPVKH